MTVRAWMGLLVAGSLVAGTLPALWVGPEPPPAPEVRAAEPTFAEPGEPDAPAPPPAAHSRVISGRVLWPDGEPFLGRGLALLRPGDDIFEPYRRTAGPEDGKFRFDSVAEGEYDLLALVGDRFHGGMTVSIEARSRWRVRSGDEDRVFCVPSSPEWSWIDLRVTDPAGRPVPRGKVIIDILGSFACTHPEVSIRDGSARCILGAPAGRVVLTVRGATDADGTPLGRITDGPFPVSKRPIRIQLPPGRTLRGRFIPPDGEKLIEPETFLPAGHGLWVHADHPTPFFSFFGGLRTGSCWCSWDTVEPDGSFRIAGLGPEPVTLKVMVLKGSRWRQPDPVPVPMDGEEILIHLTRSDSPEPRTEDPVVRAPRSEPDPTEPRSDPEPEREPDPEPRAYPERAPAVTASLRVQVDDGWGDALEPLDGEIVPEDGGPARPVSLDPSDPVIGGLDATRSYTLRFIDVGPCRVVEESRLRPGPRTVRLTTKPGLSITGRIDLPPGTIEAGLHASRGHLSIGGLNDVVIRRDGRFEVPGLLPGSWTLEVSAETKAGDWSATVEATAGGPPVRITLHATTK